MASQQPMISGIESAVLTRSVRPEMDDLSRDEARALLRIGLSPEDLDRLRELVSKNQDDALTPEEKADLESYLRLSSLFDLMHAKARRTLKKQA